MSAPVEATITYDDEYVVCPHCGCRHGDAWEWAKSQYPESMTCDGCERSFSYWAEYTATYYTKPDPTP